MRPLEADEREGLLRGAEQFRRGLYFECHETLEEVWHGLRGPLRDLVQALIQTAVAFHHLENDNGRGAASVFERALLRLERCATADLGFDVPAWRSELQERCARLRSGAAPRDVAQPRPPDWPWIWLREQA